MTSPTVASPLLRPAPTGRAILFRPDEIIVSKTDRKGIITYANQVFCRVSGYTEQELLGAPHSIVRHPDMPRCVFRLLWETIASGREIFAYVKNLARTGDHYWVHAHVTPTRDGSGEIVSYHSNRRVPSERAVNTMEAVYRELLDIESRYTNRQAGMAAAQEALVAKLKEVGMSYDEFVFSLED